MKTVVEKVTLGVLFFLVLFLLFLLLDWLFPLDIDRLNKPKSKIVYDRDGKILHISLSRDGFVRVPIDGEIPEGVRDALLSYEDRYFYHHFGINPISIFRALIFNIGHSRRVGASTITMQLSRMMHHRPRTISSKIVEMFEALQLEWHYSKDEILRFYLNSAPYGGNIEGITGASLLYFNLKLDSLSTAQSSYLISIPKNPNRNRPKERSRVEKLKERVLKSMKDNGVISSERYQLAMREKIYPRRGELPNEIPTLSRYFRSGVSKSTVDLRLQRVLKKYLQERLKQVKNLNIYNASGVIVDNFSRETLAYVGSATFWGTKHSNQIDGVKAIISAGSTLKPFIYARAFDEGVITPQKLLYDIEYAVGDFIPSNYDDRFFGEITVSEALSYSRNIPSIWLNRLLGERSLYELLREAKIDSINRAKGFYGDSLVLGGGGIRLLELANLYSALANGGVYRKVKFLQNQKVEGEEVKLFSKEASWLTMEILSTAPRGRFSGSWEFLKSKKRIAFKTGTSAHAHDMLSIGVTPKYTVAIWFGNFDRKFGVGRFDRRRSGLKVAVPAMLNIFENLEDSGWFKKPKRVVKKRVCLEPIVVKNCRKWLLDWTIEGVFLHTPCTILTPQLLHRFIRRGEIESLNDLKTHRCFEVWRDFKPVIEGVSTGKTYIKNRLLPKELKKIGLKCYSFEANQTIFWVINNQKPLKALSGESTYIYLPPDSYEIRCIDMGSKEDRVEIKIEEF